MKNYTKAMQMARNEFTNKGHDAEVLDAEDRALLDITRSIRDSRDRDDVRSVFSRVRSIANPIYRDYAHYLLLERVHNDHRADPAGLSLMSEVAKSFGGPISWYWRGLIEYNRVGSGLSENPKVDLQRAYRLFEEAGSASCEFINQSWLHVDDTIKALNFGTSFETARKMRDWNTFSPEDIIAVQGKGADSRNVRAHVIGMDKAYFEKYFDQFYNAVASYAYDIDLLVLVEGSGVDIRGLSNEYPRAYFFKTAFDFKDRKSLYTVLRFRLAQIALEMGYQELMCTDVDVKLRKHYGSFFGSVEEDIALMRDANPKAPWRGTDAKMVYFNNRSGTCSEVLSMFMKIIALNFKPNINPQGNKQWFIDQYCLGLIADGGIYGIPGFEGTKIKEIKRSDCPVVSADMVGKGKEEFFGAGR